MRTRSLAVCLLLAISTAIHAQIALPDASEISQKLTVASGDSFLFKSDSASLQRLSTLLRKYLSDQYQNPSKRVTETQIFKKFEDNPFFGREIKAISSDAKTAKLAGIISGMAGTVGGLDVTNFADGLARFLVERTKQELNSYFFKRFKEDLDQIPQLKIMFPFTHEALMSIDKNIYNYSAYIELLRDCFQKDLALILPDLQKLVDDECMNQIFSNHPVLRTILSDGLFIITDLQSGMHPGEAIHDYTVNKADSGKLSGVYRYLYPSFRTFDLLSQSVRSRQGDRYWLSGDSIRLMLGSVTTSRLYLGLIYQQSMLNRIWYDKGISLDLLMKQAADKYLPYIRGLVTKGSQVDYYFNIIRSKQSEKSGKPDYQDYYGLFDASLNLLEHIKDGTSLVGLEAPGKDEKYLDLFFNSSRSLGNIYVDIYQKQYSSAVVELSSLFGTVFSEKNISDIKDTKYGRFDELSSLLMKYGGLAAAISRAETSDEVQKAIESYAMPAGSSSVKRESQFNVAVNGYVGVIAAHEIIHGVPEGLFINDYGISAPVGVSVSWGGIKCRSKAGGNSLGFFVSVIDLGALASFRFGDDSTSTVPTIQLKDIVAPGLFFSWGIAGTPFSLAAGAQIGPLLRSVAPSINTFSDNYYWRYGVTFTVDITILNLYNKGKKNTD